MNNNKLLEAQSKIASRIKRSNDILYRLESYNTGGKNAIVIVYTKMVFLLMLGVFVLIGLPDILGYLYENIENNKYMEVSKITSIIAIWSVGLYVFSLVVDLYNKSKCIKTLNDRIDNVKRIITILSTGIERFNKKMPDYFLSASHYSYEFPSKINIDSEIEKYEGISSNYYKAPLYLRIITIALYFLSSMAFGVAFCFLFGEMMLGKMIFINETVNLIPSDVTDGYFAGCIFFMLVVNVAFYAILSEKKVNLSFFTYIATLILEIIPQTFITYLMFHH